MKKPELLIVGSFPKKNQRIYGGIARSCEILIESSYLSQFEIIKFDSSQQSKPRPVLLLRSYRAFIRLIKFPFVLSIKRPKVILIFCSSGFSAVEKGIMITISKLFRIPVLIFPRAGSLIKQVEGSKLFLFIIKSLFSNANYFLCQGENWRQFALDKIKFDSERTRIISNWTATNDLLELGSSKNHRNSKKLINFLFVGWVIKEKGVEELILAFKKLKLKGYNIKLTITGDGNLLKSLKKYVYEHSLSNEIFFTGWLNKSDLKKVFEKNDAFVLPSWEEGMPNSLIEALASGLSCITSNVGVVSNYLVNNHHALYVKPGDIDDIENAMERIIIDSELRKNLSKSGHLLAKNVFLTNNSLKNLASTLNQLAIS